MTKQEAEKKVYELTDKLLFVKKDFKDIASGYKEKIRKLKMKLKQLWKNHTQMKDKKHFNI